MSEEKKITPLDVLKRAREILSDENRWTKGAAARTAQGLAVGHLSVGAVRFCSFGAIDRAGYELKSKADYFPRMPHIIAGDIMDELVLEVTGFTLVSFNDNEDTCHAEVIAMFDRAIAKLEAGKADG